ncbi:MAG: tetratricopeptide repeat protein [Polyangiaceae bacterium]
MESARTPQSDAPPPSAAAGTLGATPLAHIFVHARQRGLTGVLRLVPDERASEALDVSLVRGFVRAATPVTPQPSELPIARLVVRAFSFPQSTRFSFRPASELEAVASGRPDLEPFALVWAGLRAHGVESTAKKVLGRLGTRPLLLADDVSLDRYGFTAEERRIAERFRAPSRPGMARLEVLVAYVLAITKGLVLAPEGTSPVRPDPKRFSTPPVGSVRAPRVTGDSRADFQAAEIALAQHDVERADVLCRAAYDANPRHPETMALLGWLRTLRPDGHALYALREATDLLDRAIDLDASCERAYNYRAQIRRAAGDIAGALEDFRSASRLNPHNVEAAREVRLHDLRAKRAAEDERKSSGLFHRILGKK